MIVGGGVGVSLLTTAKKSKIHETTDYQTLQIKFDIKIYPFGGRGFITCKSSKSVTDAMG
jgi:hypothetical protein